MDFRLPDIRLPLEVPLQLFAQPFELPAAHIFQVHAIRPRGRRFIKKHWYAVAFPNFVPDAPRQRHAIVQRHALNGDKWQHIRRAHSRMRAGVLGEVDQLHGFACALKCSLSHRIRFSRQRHHAAVVVCVHLPVQNIDTRHTAHRRNKGFHFCGVASFGEIRDAFNQSLHRFGFLSCCPGQFAGSFGLRSGSVGRS